MRMLTGLSSASSTRRRWKSFPDGFADARGENIVTQVNVAAIPALLAPGDGSVEVSGTSSARPTS